MLLGVTGKYKQKIIGELGRTGFLIDMIYRLTPGDGYLEALCEDNVTVRTEGIIPDDVVMNDGTDVKLDALICATGFKASFRPPFKLVGEDDAALVRYGKVNPKRTLILLSPSSRISLVSDFLLCVLTLIGMTI